MSYLLKKLFSNRHSGKIYTALVVAFFVFFVPTSYAHAAWYWPPDWLRGAANLVTGIASDAIAQVFVWTASLMASIAGIFLSLAGWFVDFALSLNSEVFTLPVVLIGWRIVRDVANLGFVLGIIVIAFATIVGSQTYGIKKTLFKLIVIAVLINFSLSICGVFLDASAIATNFFLSKATPAGTPALSDALSQAFKPQKLWETKDLSAAVADTATDGGKKVLQAIASLFFIIIFSWMGVVTYFALGIMLFIRFVEVAFLLILAPIAWLGWIFPGLSVGGQGHIASMWLQRFIKWTFFPPIVAFFIYLALFAVQQQSASITMKNSAGTELNKELLIGSAGSGPSFTATIASMFIFCGLLMGGLVAANKMSITGAGIAENYAYKAQRYLGGAARGTANWAGRRFMAQGAKTSEEGETTTRAQRAAAAVSTTLSSIPVLGRTARAGERVVSRLSQDMLEKTKKIQGEKFGRPAMTDAGVLDLMEHSKGLNQFEKAAITLEAASRKLLKNFSATPDQLKPFIEAVTRIGALEDTEKKVLSEGQSHGLAVLFPSRDTPGTQMTIEESMRRYGSASKSQEFSMDDLRNPTIINQFTANYISKMASDGSGAKQKQMVETIQGGLRPVITQALKDIYTNQETIAERLKELEELGSARSPAEQAELVAAQGERRRLKGEEDAILTDPANGNFAKLLKEVIKNPLTAGYVT